MAVTTVDGLIGRVVRVAPFHSTVQLITNLNDKANNTKSIAATVLGNEEASFGIIQSYDRAEGVLLMTKISQDDPLKVGDIIVSSGLGQVFPKGLVIGEVVEREVGEFGITHVAKIKPAADFSRLYEVFVVEMPEM
jgi:rod shape-determining protein MreC